MVNNDFFPPFANSAYLEMGLDKLLAEYTVEKTIGQGAFSKVKLAIHNVSGEKVIFAN